jgi:hypothetical protein
MSGTCATGFYALANQQAARLRAGKLADAGISNIVAALATLGRCERRKPFSRLPVLRSTC